jgi:serine/threonine protein phosphatase 1
MSETRRFVIGDIHGCLKTFRAMVEEVIRLEKQDQLFLLGDYIDRGPDSKGVIDYIIQLQGESGNIFPMMGNHEYMLVRSMDESRYFDLWQMNGCEATLLSFGVPEEKTDSRESVFMIPENYIRFFSDLPFYRETEGYIIVHAGIPPDVETLADPDEIMLWTRDESVNRSILGDRRLVHGHTPVAERLIRERVLHKGSMVYNLDAGCIYKNYTGLGNLAALDLDSHELYFIKNRDI